MKKILFSTILTLAATATMTLTTSCEDQLDIEQKGVIPSEKFYQTDADAEAALVAAYEGFMCNVVGRNHDGGGPGIYTPYKIITNMCGDDVLYASGNYGDHEFSGMLNEFRYDAEAEVPKFMYTGLYLSVYTCNLVTDHFQNAADTPVKKRCVAEARVLRAFDYFLLANLWNNPPFIDHVLAGTDLPYNCNKDPENPMDHKQLIQWVAKECEEAAADLDERKGTDDKDGAVKVTKGFAWALAGKAYLFAGEYDKAKTALKKVIDSGKYALVPGDRYMDNFHIEGDGNEEKVFEINFEYNAGKGAWAGMIQRSSWMESNAWNWRAGNFVKSPQSVYSGIDGWGGLGVPQWFGDEFYANDGDSYRFKATLKHIDDAVYKMEYADPALNAMSVEEKMKSKEVGINDPVQGLYDNSFWLAFKQIIRKADTDGNKYGDNIRLNNYVVMRYAEVLLNYAEACLNTGDQSEAKKYINMIQERAGSKTISQTVDMDVLKREKSYELWLEGCRWFDVMRWKDAKAIERLKNVGSDCPHVFDKLFRAPKADDRKVTWEHGTEANSRFYTVSTSAAKDAGFEVGFKEGKHEFFPYPQTVKDKNPNLEQNPGW
ncbi:MAG: RagB/SusD family nutrient uptake outer membrane protein [Segatella copri]|uniref:RagB/SusD family nutrient uptake outer membrane protein n=1 Tax=Prevotella sp. Sow4_E9_plate TaxID=3438802 RepID=UPI0025F5D6EF|nr:RagB/SusD family nutrient uptake outer membrane protein [Prevotella sp.]